MSLIIKGMEMPKENEILVFDMWHGKMYARSTANTGAKSYEVVPLPEGHGDLIDRDALRKEIDANRPGRSYEDGWELTVMDHAPAIVPAEGVTDE